LKQSLTSGIPLGAHIPKRIKEKIWANEYIDLSALLPKNVDNDLWSVTFAPNTVTLQNQLWKLTLESVQQLFPGNTDVDCI
jgi:hypothetical protein